MIRKTLAVLALVTLAACAGNKSAKETLSDEQFLDLMEQEHLGYMWDGAAPNSGMAPERIHMDGVYPENDADIIAVGGSGFGIAGLIAGMERGYVTR